MTIRKTIRVLLLAAASLFLILVAVQSPKEAKQMEQLDDIIVSQEDSFCEGDLVLELSSLGEYPIYYTLDGSNPTLDSNFYEGPITFSGTDEVQSTVLRARTYDESTGVWGDMFTRTYFYARELETIQNRFSTNIVCITSDPYNLYDYEHGIMIEGKIREEYINSPEYIPDKLTQPANFTQEGRAWERDAYIEILSPEGELLISQDGGIRIFGHASRQYYYKSFKLYAREEYGDSTFSYPIFSDNMLGKSDQIQDEYERLVVRAHGFDKSFTLFREELFQRLCSQIEGIDTKTVTPASVWLNGAYYNFEWIQEVFDDYYFEENYGLMQYDDTYRKVTLRNNKVREDVEANDEDLQAYADYEALAEYADKDMTDEAVYREFCKLMDVERMLQYYAIQTYIANWDWPLNNVKMYRYYSSNGVYGDGHQDGRWRYLYYDMEAGFNIYNENPEDWMTIESVLENAPLLRAVMVREDCQQTFTKYLSLCIDEYFTTEKVREAIEQLKSERDGELRETFAYKQSIDPNYTMGMDDVEGNIDIIYDFVEKRPAIIEAEAEALFGIRLEEIE